MQLFVKFNRLLHVMIMTSVRPCSRRCHSYDLESFPMFFSASSYLHGISCFAQIYALELLLLKYVFL